MKYRTKTILLLIVLIPAPLAACLWDSDTLEEERQQFPSVLELITGKFLRHSPAFYDWRIEDRKKRIEAEPDNVALYDDLAVAYEKTGQTDLAIETILKKEEISPGLYETYANLGTFYIHAGRLEEGLQEIEKAIEINPDAHFGREVYQKLIVQFVLSRQDNGKLKLPMDQMDGPPYGFAVFVMLPHLKQGNDWLSSKCKTEVKAATTGVLGMMRFGTLHSPVLLETLASLLLSKDYSRDAQEQAKQLAARALLQASYSSKDIDQRTAYRDSAKDALIFQTYPGTFTQISLDEVESQFQKELAESTAWYEDLIRKEEQWIEAGLNPEKEYARLNIGEVRVSEHPLPERASKAESSPTHLETFVVAASLAVLATIVIIMLRRRHKRQRTDSLNFD